MIRREDEDWEPHLRDACEAMQVRPGVFEFLRDHTEYDGRDWLLGVLCRLHRHQPHTVANASLNWWRSTMHEQDQRRAYRTRVRREQQAIERIRQAKRSARNDDPVFRVLL